MSQRHEEPQFMKDYRAWLESGAPPCCHTCEHYEKDGRCAIFDMHPPADFAAKIDSCDSYQQAVPF